MTLNQLHYLTAMGIQPWGSKQGAITASAPILYTDSVISAEPSTGPTTSSCSNLSSWPDLEAAVRACIACELHQTRTQTVFGVGDRNADLMIIGEAPGFHEDQQGEPFVGRAGQLLNAMLESIGFSRNKVFIANILKCRPPNNRDPQVLEVATCTPFLEKQIALIQPKLLLAVGRIAAQYLLDTKTSLAQLRGKIHTFGTTPLIITYHPAYLLRNPKDKGKAFQDLQMVFRTLGEKE